MGLAAQLRAAKAIDEVTNGRSIRAASKLHQVERTYLRRRIEGIQTREEYNKSRQKVTDVLEDRLAKWIVTQGQLGYAPPHARFRAYAQRLLVKSGSRERLGKRWVTRFLQRHHEVRTFKGWAIDYRRLNGATEATCKVLFDRLVLPKVRKIYSRNRYNADEFGMMEGMGENSLVLGEAFKKFILLKDAFKRAWISVITCISADGRALPPLIIFSGVNVQQQWFPDTEDQPYKDWYFTASSNGWTNTDIRLKWLRKVFIPHTKPANPREWRLLIIDGHNSHTTEEFMWTCLINRIYIVFLPSHSSYVWQPLDMGIFSVLKRRFRYWFRERCYGRSSEATDKTDFLWALATAWKEVMGVSRYIKQGFKASGMWPINRDRALKSPYVKKSNGAGNAPVAKPSAILQQPDFLEPIASIGLNTPKSSKDLKILEKALIKVDPAFGKATGRLLFRKVGKALDISSSELTALENHNNQLTSALEKARPKKLKKVETNPNQEFVRLKNVREVKAGLKSNLQEPSSITPQNEAQDKEEEEKEYDTDDPDCICHS
ncbi:hypothetical protein DL764_008115 [Monosporascus ibericus]|uniref:HTH CENPB-type domain-containing protein n=1 Tax=Monosporascus ibericus TaxID=155417 RepID=A0A4Q4SYA7_9PEZI|nr:hypothetical protein DL764_008115 [Monosporascus ibericus]